MVSPAQQSLIGQFCSLTGQSPSAASQYLRASGFRLNAALDAFYQRHDAVHVNTAGLERLFESLKIAEDTKDTLSVDSTMNYFSEHLQANLENFEFFVAAEAVRSPSIGAITREGFIEGWSKVNQSDDINVQRAYIQSRIKAMARDPDVFRTVYRQAFLSGKEKEQKALQLDNAILYWSSLLDCPGFKWQTVNNDWLNHWTTFLKAKWTRSVSRDMWNQTLEFAKKSMVDEELSFWNEDGAWPAVIDEFVAWFNEEKK